jgi:GDPmannose 4,6-dehydratase
VSGNRKVALITGITGQDGSYLAELLLEKGYQVCGMLRRASTSCLERLEGILDRLQLVPGNLLDAHCMERILQDLRPTEVYNLASMSFVQASWEQPILTAEVTGLGTTRLLEAIRQVDPSIRFYQASSSEMFGLAAESPQNEHTLFHPRSPYGVAKVYAHHTTVNYRESHGLYAVSGILFNHESPRRGLEFVTRKVTDTAARIKLGRASELVLGNLEARRDWGFAGDYVDAIWRMLQQEEPEDLVVGTGISHSVQDLVECAFAVVDLDWREYTRQDPRFLRPAEVDNLVADSTLARNRLGWRPSVGFEELVTMMVQADLARHVWGWSRGSTPPPGRDRRSGPPGDPR